MAADCVVNGSSGVVKRRSLHAAYWAMALFLVVVRSVAGGGSLGGLASYAGTVRHWLRLCIFPRGLNMVHDWPLPDTVTAGPALIGLASWPEMGQAWY